MQLNIETADDGHVIGDAFLAAPSGAVSVAACGLSPAAGHLETALVLSADGTRQRQHVLGLDADSPPALYRDCGLRLAGCSPMSAR